MRTPKEIESAAGMLRAGSYLMPEEVGLVLLTAADSLEWVLGTEAPDNELARLVDAMVEKFGPLK